MDTRGGPRPLVLLSSRSKAAAQLMSQSCDDFAVRYSCAHTEANTKTVHRVPCQFVSALRIECDAVPVEERPRGRVFGSETARVIHGAANGARSGGAGDLCTTSHAAFVEWPKALGSTQPCLPVDHRGCM